MSHPASSKQVLLSRRGKQELRPDLTYVFYAYEDVRPLFVMDAESLRWLVAELKLDEEGATLFVRRTYEGNGVQYENFSLSLDRWGARITGSTSGGRGALTVFRKYDASGEVVSVEESAEN